MHTYKGISACKATRILMNVAQGIAAVSGHDVVISDLVIDLTNMRKYFYNNARKDAEYYFTLREIGTISHENREECFKKAKDCSYPVVIAKVVRHKACVDDYYDLTLMFTTFNGNFRIEKELENDFNSL